MKTILKNLNRNLYEKPIFIAKEDKVFQGLPIESKDIILRYLKSFNPEFATSRVLYDEILHQNIDGYYDVGYFDGIYSWDERDIYHFEKYNMPLKQKFIDYVLTKTLD